MEAFHHLEITTGLLLKPFCVKQRKNQLWEGWINRTPRPSKEELKLCNSDSPILKRESSQDFSKSLDLLVIKWQVGFKKSPDNYQTLWTKTEVDLFLFCLLTAVLLKNCRPSAKYDDFEGIFLFLCTHAKLLSGQMGWQETVTDPRHMYYSWELHIGYHCLINEGHWTSMKGKQSQLHSKSTSLGLFMLGSSVGTSEG